MKSDHEGLVSRNWSQGGVQQIPSSTSFPLLNMAIHMSAAQKSCFFFTGSVKESLGTKENLPV